MKLVSPASRSATDRYYRFLISLLFGALVALFRECGIF